MQGGFHSFLRPYLRRHFHCIGLDRDGFDPRQLSSDSPVIVYANHPSWWDPLIAHFLNLQLFSPRQFYAPIDAVALKQYGVFEKLGFYGIDLTSTSGAAAFLKTSTAIVTAPATALWVTPEGRFCDVRDQSAVLMPGLAHLCAKLGSARVIPMSLEYAFWDERLPICAVRFGQPLDTSISPAVSSDDVQAADRGTRRDSKAEWNRLLTQRLRDNQGELAATVIARDPASLESLLLGRVGAGGLYDSMRRCKSWITRQSFRPEHGQRF